MMSCQLPNGSSNIFSVGDNDDDDDNDNVAVAERRRDSSRNRRPCEDRDSCQDSCDYMFRNSRARSECYELSFDDVSDLESVFDELHASSISKRSLEDIDVNDFEDFLALDTDGWVDIIVGEEGSDHDNHEAYSSSDAKSALEWIAENENVARAIARADEHHDTLYHLFLQLGDGISSSSYNRSPSSPSIRIYWCEYGVSFGSSCSSNPHLPLSGSVIKFIASFVGAGSGLSFTTGSSTTYSDLQFDGDSFITYAYDEDNEQAVELAHQSLLRFCEDGTGDELPDEDVQQCMLAAYCNIYSEEGGDEDIFEDVLSAYSADKEHCGINTLKNNERDKLEDLFD